MLQSWDNFMSPSGGNMDNSLQFGMESIGIEIGAALSSKYVWNPLQKRDIKGEVERSYNARDRSNINKNYYQMGRKNSLPRSSATARLWRNRQHANAATSARWADHKSSRERMKTNIGNIKSKYSKLKFGARAIGWGYVALAAASIAEAAATPGLSVSAERNNAETMGMAPPLDSSQAYTQRQRALMAIHDSQLGIRNVIGAEAGYLHR
tara:strand:+ start:50861 stop:51487 length:627 start_codon:yes stop_codon:yes gene_type:complete